MSDSFPVVTLSADNFFPGSYISVNLGAGGNAGNAAPVNVLLCGNALATSSAVIAGQTNTVVFGPDVEGARVASEADVINTFGARSELHLGFLEFVKTNPGVPVYLLAVAESGGSAAATGSITFAGTAVKPGSVRVYAGDNVVDVGINVGDGYAVVATNVANAVNSVQTIPATASAAASGVVTLTASNKGPRGNYIRFAAKVQGVAVGITSSAQAFANFSGGTTADVWTTALATINPKKFKYIVAAAEDTTPSTGNLALLASQVTTQALPIPGIRQRLVAGVSGSISTANAAAKALNNPLVGIVWQQSGNKTPFQLACQTVAGLTLGENQSVPQLNFDFLGGLVSNAAYFKCSNPFDGSAPSRADLTSALASGVSPVMNGVAGAQLVSMITTYTQDGQGNIDTRIRDWGVVTVMFYVADMIQSMWASQFAGKLAASDPPKGQSLPNANVVTPSVVKTSINQVLKNAWQNGLLDSGKLADMQALTKVVLDAYTPGRFDALVNVLPVQIAHQLAVNLNQLSQIL